MGGSAGRAARRLACYIDAIGDRPALTERGFRRDYQALLAQYTALPLLVRKEARRKGRSIIRGAGLGAAMAKLIPAQEQPSLHTAGKASRAEEIALLMAQSLGRCPSCKSWGRGKRAFPSRELALAFLPFSGDMSLQIYKCANHGSYHLGHQRRTVVRESCSCPRQSSGINNAP